MQKKKTEEKKLLFKQRHSLAHLLAAAIMEKYPEASLAIGPVIENGFYYDIDTSAYENGLSDKDFPKLEKRMRELIKKHLTFKKREISYTQAKKMFTGNPYKQELIEDLKKAKKKITVYETGTLHRQKSASGQHEFVQFIDLCSGPHVKNTDQIPTDAFALTHIAGAYWRGDEKNAMLTRVYGVAFSTKKELTDYMAMLKEAKRRDHKKLGKKLGLFVFSDVVGKGLPLWTAKGAVIRRELENFIVQEELRRGYQHVYTPELAEVELYRQSGHYPYYKDSMYPPMVIDNEELILRPMTCPHHFQLYLSKPRSYRELPMRIAELAKLFRYEKSGELAGLLRVRSFCLADAHIICADTKQAKEEISVALDLIEYVAKVLGLSIGKDYSYRLSLGSRTDTKKYYKDDKAWATAERALRAVLKARKSTFVEAKDEAAFYGPKIDIQMKNVMGKEETAFTVQYDFVMPKRFNLNYIDQRGKEKETIVIHRSSIGAIERTIAFLIERYAGAFPVWLSPIQVAVLPVSEKHSAYANSIFTMLKKANIRAELYSQDQTLGKRIRETELQKIPYVLILGDKEKKAKTVSVRTYKKGDIGVMKTDVFVKKVLKDIEKKRL